MGAVREAWAPGRQNGVGGRRRCWVEAPRPSHIVSFPTRPASIRLELPAVQPTTLTLRNCCSFSISSPLSFLTATACTSGGSNGEWAHKWSRVSDASSAGCLVGGRYGSGTACRQWHGFSCPVPDVGAGPVLHAPGRGRTVTPPRSARYTLPPCPSASNHSEPSGRRQISTSSQQRSHQAAESGEALGGNGISAALSS